LTANATAYVSVLQTPPTRTAHYTLPLPAALPTSSPGTCALTPTATTGVASCSVGYTPGTAGSATITAAYAGDLIHQNSSGSATVERTRRPLKSTDMGSAFAVCWLAR